MRFHKVLLLGLVLLGLAAVGSQAVVRNLTLSSSPNELTLVGQEGDALHYRVQVGELTAMDVMTKEGSFTRLLIIPGSTPRHVEGAPELPMMNRLIEIPTGAVARDRGDLDPDPQLSGSPTSGSRTGSSRRSRACRRTPIRRPGRSSSTEAPTPRRAWARNSSASRTSDGFAPSTSVASRSRRSSTSPRENRIEVQIRSSSASSSTGPIRRAETRSEGANLQPVLRAGLRQGRRATGACTTSIPTWCATSSPW